MRNIIAAALAALVTTPALADDPSGAAAGLGIAAIMFFLIMLGLYFLPSIIAVARGHRQMAAIVALNFFLGWTVLGWVLSLVWSLMSPNNAQTIIIQQSAAPAQNPPPTNPPSSPS